MAATTPATPEATQKYTALVEFSLNLKHIFEGDEVNVTDIDDSTIALLINIGYIKQV